MTILSVLPSREICTEANWDAVDLQFASPVTPEQAAALRGLGGSFLCLSQLAQPFYKVETHRFVLRGVCGQTHMRLACDRLFAEEELQRVRRFLETIG